MISVIDNSFLTLFLNPEAVARPDPSTGVPTPYFREKIEDLIDTMNATGGKLIIPAPVLAETLCYRRSSDETVSIINGVSCFDVRPFDGKAEIELAELMKSNKSKIREIRRENSAKSQAVKFDLQIVAIGAAHGAKVMYTDDSPQSNFATLAGLEVKHTWNLPLSDKRRQIEMWEGGDERP